MKRPPLPFVLSTIAVVWSVAVGALAYLLPVYSVESDVGSCSPGAPCTSTTTHGSASLVEVNGDRVLVVIAILAAVALVGWVGLHLYCAFGVRAGLIAGWSAAIAMTAVGLISFGLWIFILPTAIMMIVAAATTPGPGATSRT